MDAYFIGIIAGIFIVIFSIFVLIGKNGQE